VKSANVDSKDSKELMKIQKIQKNRPPSPKLVDSSHVTRHTKIIGGGINGPNPNPYNNPIPNGPPLSEHNPKTKTGSTSRHREQRAKKRQGRKPTTEGQVATA
jgi:hypothetical protein